MGVLPSLNGGEGIKLRKKNKFVLLYEKNFLVPITLSCMFRSFLFLSFVIDGFLLSCRSSSLVFFLSCRSLSLVFSYLFAYLEAGPPGFLPFSKINKSFAYLVMNISYFAADITMLTPNQNILIPHSNSENKRHRIS